MADNSASAGSGSGESAAHRDVTAQRDRLRGELIAAAEAEAAAIVDAARQEIAVIVRRAHRDLLLIRAQVQPFATEQVIMPAALEPRRVEPVQAPVPDPDIDPVEERSDDAEAAPRELPSDVPLLRHVDEHRDEVRIDLEPRRRPRGGLSLMRVLASPAVIAALVLVLFATGAVTGWVFWRERRVSAKAETQTTAAGRPVAAVSENSVPTSAVPEDGKPLADKKADDPPAPASSPARIVVRTVRPVWLRIDVDEAGDTGRLYAADTTKELTPSRSLVIRAGDAGAVMLAIGNGSLAPLGPAGQVLTRRFDVGDGEVRPIVKQPDTTAASAAPPKASTASSARPAAPEPVRSAARTTEPTLAAPAIVPAAPVGNAPVPAAPAASVVQPPSSPAAIPPAPDSRAPAAASPQVTAQQHADILARHSQWLDAYSRGDQRALALITAQGFSLRDERAGRGAGAAPVSAGQLSEVRIDVVGVGAVLTARLRGTVNGVSDDSMLSEVWVRGDQQQWVLMGVRITPVEGIRRPGR